MHKVILLRQASCCSMYRLGMGWVGWGHGSIISPGSGLGLVGSVIGGLGP